MADKDRTPYTNEIIRSTCTNRDGMGYYRRDRNGQWWYIHRTGRKRAHTLKCKICKKRFIAQQRTGKVCSKECNCEFVSRDRLGSKHFLWKGGRVRTTQGYIYIYSRGHPCANACEYVAEHRLVMEKMLGRYLLPNETVHHKNGIRDDNSEGNLELRSGMHGAGSEVKDLIEFAVRILRTYKPGFLDQEFLHVLSLHDS